MKAQRQEQCSVSPLKQGGQLISNSKGEAEILNDQFCSVFSSEDQDQLPEIPGDPAPSIPNLDISLDGVTKLLTNLNSSKAVGPEKIPNQVLK